MAWSLASQPGAWRQLAVTGLSASAMVTQGLRMQDLLAQAERLDPHCDLERLHICLTHIEHGRLTAEAELRKQETLQ